MTQYTKKEALELVQDSLAKSHRESDLDWTDIKEKHPIMEHSSDNLRKYSTGWKLLSDWGLVDFSQIDINTELENKPAYKETTEILAGGVQRSDKLIKMNDKQSKDVEYMLKAHGFDPNEFELISVKNNIWNTNSKTQGVQTLYSSKISVKPKVDGFNVDKLIEKLKIKPSILSYKEKQGENLLVIPYFDKHFGISTFEHYIPVLSKTISKIQSKTWSKILLICGQDELHNDGFTGQTTSGTMIDKVDMEKAWADAFNFESAIIDEAIKNSNSVEVVFSAGNHDQAMGWALAKALEVKYPQLYFNTEMKQFKAFTWENIFLGITHGDKANQQRAIKAILAEYGKLMTASNTREILTGHLHHTKTHDDFGIVYRTLGSGVPTDSYHADHAFIGAMKQFQMLEYNKDFIEAIYYI